MEKQSVAIQSWHRRITVQIIVDVVIWLIVSLPVLYLFLNGQPYQTGFFCDDPSLSYPSKPSTVSTSILIASGLTASVFLVVLVEIFYYLDNKRRQPCQWTKHIMHCIKSYIVFLVGFLIEEMVVEVVKNNMGALRPNFFEVCKPQFNRTLCPGYITEYTCTKSESDKSIRSSRQSFPSGHSAFSMYIAAYFCIYMEQRLQIRFSHLLKIFVQAGLLLLAILCGIGRIKDNKHHPSDVIAGFILGITVAIFVNILVGKKIVNSTTENETPSLDLSDKSSDCCCACNKSRDLEEQTSLQFLQNDSFSILDNERNSSSAKLLSLQCNDGSRQFQTENV